MKIHPRDNDTIILEVNNHKVEVSSFGPNIECIITPNGTGTPYKLTLANDTQLIEVLWCLPLKWNAASRAAQILTQEARLQRTKDVYFA